MKLRLGHFCAWLAILFTLHQVVPVKAFGGCGESCGNIMPPPWPGPDLLTSGDVLQENFALTAWRTGVQAAANTSPPQAARGYNWTGPPPETPDWPGIQRDTVYFITYQFAAIIVLYLAPESLSGWDQEAKDSYSFERWKENVSYPVWDDDKWYVNYVLHPYWGGTYYIRGRERGFGRIQSFWYAAILSALYEYGAEALFEPVSVQDLIVTPLGGALLGEYLYSPIRQYIRSKEHLQWTDKAVLFITDPLGVVNSWTDRLLGVKTQVDFGRLQFHSLLPLTCLAQDMEFPQSAPARPKSAWGLQLKMRW